MKFLISIVLLLLSSVDAATSADSSQQIKVEKEVSDERIQLLERKIEFNSQDLALIRRDQLTYQIEKDLLKEAYSSSLSMINIVITLILGAFTVIGVLGVRSIENIRKEFRRELEQLISLKTSIEAKMQLVVSEIDDAKIKYAELVKVNEEQNGRLRLLEAQEKAASSMREKNYKHALKYIGVGLQVNEKDPVLNSLRYSCFLKLNQLSEAVGAIEFAIACDPDNRVHKSNLIEVSILLGELDKAKRIIEESREQVFTKEYVYLEWYFDALIAFMSGDVKLLIRILSVHPVENPEEKARRMNWSYSEAINVLARMKGESGYRLIYQCLRFLSGECSLSELNDSLTNETNNV